MFVNEKMHFEKEIYISGTCINAKTPTFVIAEAGVNHNGDIEVAKQMIDVAVEAGANAVKFQTFKTEDLILTSIEKAPYQKKTTDVSENQYMMLKKLEVSFEHHKILQKYCQERGIIFLTTPFESTSLKEIEQLDVPAIKVAATDLTNIKFLREVAALGKPIILSAGMCYMDEVRMALESIYPINKNVILLQCTANYPIKDEEANISVIDTFKKEFDILIGYSDHSVGVGASPYAVAKGAKVIEKHFTLDKDMSGPDHKASVTPDELKQLINEIRKVERYLGKDIKIPTFSEQGTRKSLQKCFVAARNIEQGECFTEKNIVAKRTNGEGISALYYDQLLLKKATRSYKVNDIIME